MLRSDKPRVRYRTPQLREVICQIRFPSILSIGAKEPADFQEAVRGVFPRYAVRQDQLPPKVVASGGSVRMEQPQPVANYHFLSADSKWKLNLTRDFISLSTIAYTSWEEFGQKLDQPLARFIKLYQPAFLQRIGLRYVNLFSRKALGLEDTPWRELFTAPYLGVLAQEDVAERTTLHSTVGFDIALDSSCRAKVQAGPGLVKQTSPDAAPDKELKFVLDLDLYMGGELQPMLAAGALETLHGHSTALFRGAVTEALHRAMDPE